MPRPGDLPDSGVELVSPAWQADSLPTEPPWEGPHRLVITAQISPLSPTPSPE